MADEINVKGLSELQQFLNAVPAKMEQNILRGGLRQGANVIKPVAQANIHSRSGELARGLKVKTRSRMGTVTARLVATGKHWFIARWLEYGTAAHEIKARAGGWLSIFGFFAKSVMHPGSAPKPFLRPAMDTQAMAAVVVVGNYIKNRLATKESFNTAYIKIEGDE